MNKLEKAKEIIKKHLSVADCGIFNSRNTVGDLMINVYDKDGLMIDICYNYSYYEVFGLSTKEFSELAKYYWELVGYETTTD